MLHKVHSYNIIARPSNKPPYASCSSVCHSVSFGLLTQRLHRKTKVNL